MYKMIIELLSMNDFYGVSENIDISKGKYKYPTTLKEGLKKIKRITKTKL